jgi:hypothetical protein
MNAIPASSNRNVVILIGMLIAIFLVLALNIVVLLYMINGNFMEMNGMLDIFGLRGYITNQMVQSCRELMQNVP